MAPDEQDLPGEVAPDPGELELEVHHAPPWDECHVCRRMRAVDGQTVGACQACGDPEYLMGEGQPWRFRTEVEVVSREQRRKGELQVVKLEVVHPKPRRRWTKEERERHDQEAQGLLTLHLHRADAFPPGAKLALVLVEVPVQDARQGQAHTVVAGDKLELVANVGKVEEHVAVATVVSYGDVLDVGNAEPGLRISWRKPRPQSGALGFTYTHVRLARRYGAGPCWWCKLDPACNAGSDDPVRGGFTWHPEHDDLALTWPAGCLVAFEGSAP